MLHFGQIDFQVLGSSTQQLFLKALSQYFSSMFLNWLRLICLCLISSGRVFQTLVTLMKYEHWKVCDLHFLGRNKRMPLLLVDLVTLDGISGCHMNCKTIQNCQMHANSVQTCCQYGAYCTIDNRSILIQEQKENHKNKQTNKLEI